MRFFLLAVASALFPSSTIAAPTAANHSKQPDSLDILNNLQRGVRDGKLTGEYFFNAVLSELKGLVPGSKPESISQAMSELASIYAAKPSFLEASAQLVLKGLTPGSFIEAVDAYNNAEDSPVHSNTRVPNKPVYPRREAGDAPYTQSLLQLRQQIYIPPEFTYGEKQPVVFVPGTGSRGFVNFDRNIAKYLRDTPHADPVYINPPAFQLNDSQLNGESAAYAINYISGISKNRKVTVISWSQGGINAQWAFKYWPSTRKNTNSLIAISPDYHGTVEAGALCGFAQECAPSLFDQYYDSAFITALRHQGGDSALVPTTNIYSALFDEIVEPQEGSGASAVLGDSNGVGVTNVELQSTCGRDNPGGTVYGHESVLFASLTEAIVMDVMKHGGAADLKRINVPDVCQAYAAPQLNLDDLLQTESIIPLAGYEILAYPDKVSKQPPLKSYAIGH